jgi:hypothetical protein
MRSQRAVVDTYAKRLGFTVASCNYGVSSHDPFPIGTRFVARGELWELTDRTTQVGPFARKPPRNAVRGRFAVGGQG